MHSFSKGGQLFHSGRKRHRGLENEVKWGESHHIFQNQVLLFLLFEAETFQEFVLTRGKELH